MAKAFVDGTLSTELPSWDALAANERRQSQRISKKLYFRQDPGLDIALIHFVFESFPLPADASNAYERQRSIAFWKEVLNCILNILGRGDEEIERIDGTPGKFEDWGLEKIAQVLLQLHPSEDRQAFWKPILNLGAPAHYWIEKFLRDWMWYGFTLSQYEHVFIQVWKEMMGFVFSSPKWDHNIAKHSHELAELWNDVIGFSASLPDLQGEHKTRIVTQMRPYYKRWVSLHLVPGYNGSIFMDFLQTPAVKNICLDGLLWLEQAASEKESDFRHEQYNLAKLLVFYWQNHRARLRQHSTYWEAFTNFLQQLVRQGNNIAIELSRHISPETKK